MIPSEVNELIEKYLNLKLGGKKVQTPYHINIKHVRAGLRSLVGKGTPEEIEEEVRIFAKLKDFDLEKASEKKIREFMQEQGIGIDCSGFVTQILDMWLKVQNKGNLRSKLHFPKVGFLKKILILLRPIENINADLLTNNENTVKVDYKDVKIGDLFRLKGLKRGDHIAFVTNVTDNKEIEYIHSSRYYGEQNGVRKGVIKIIDSNKSLDKQNWLEVDDKGICWTLKQYTKEKEDNGFRRLKFCLEEK